MTILLWSHGVALHRGVTSQVTGAALLVVGLVVGAGLVFASIYVIGGPSAKTVLETSTQLVPVTTTAVQTQSLTQTSTTTTTTTEFTPSTTTVTETVASVIETTSTGGGGGGGSNLVTVSGNLIVPTGTTTGNLMLNIKNGAANPIIGILATFPTSMTGPGAANSCYGIVAQCNAGAINFQFNGAAITAANPLPVGSETSATSAVTQTAASALQSGNIYSFTITITFADGSPQTQLISKTAQL
jgi:hypothetical protein